MNDYFDEYATLEDLKTELEPIKDFLQINHQGEHLFIGLKSNISFKDFNKFFPDISKKQLIKLFDYCEMKQDELKFIVEDWFK